MNAVVHRGYEGLRTYRLLSGCSPTTSKFQNPGALYNTLTVENLYAGCQPVRRYQLLTGFMRGYKSAVTGSSFMEARSEGSLNLMRDSSLRLSGRRPELEKIGNVTKLTIDAARCDKDKEVSNQNKELFSMGIGVR